MQTKINEIAWLIIAICCAVFSAYLVSARGIGNQDTLVLLFATLIAAAMYGYRRNGRKKAEKGGIS